MSAELWRWRREVADLYAAIRTAAPEPGWQLWCRTRAALFAQHPESPIDARNRAVYGGPHVFPYDPALRVRTALDAAAGETLLLAAGADGTVEASPFARTRGLAARFGAELTLYWLGGYGGGVFLPFQDATSGRETYGGGRYLIDSIKGADPCPSASDGALWLDFNLAYFPSCAYSNRWACPLAPPGNRLAAPVRGGERLPIPGTG